MKVQLAVALGLLSSIAPAAADSRDLVLERMSRCYVLTDTRQYLECLYGAAQPLRSELGLSPAPQATSFAGLFARPAAQPAYTASAATAPPPPVAVQPASIRPPEKGFASDVLSTVMGIRTTGVPPEQFGLANARPGPGINVDHITARMAQYSLSQAGGSFTVTLVNGQVWRQSKGDEHDPTWDKPASSYAVTVSYGAGGTYNLVVAGERQPYKVTRIR